MSGFAESPPFCERRRRDQGKCHNGWACLRFADEATASGAARALHDLRLGGCAALSAAPARALHALSDAKAKEKAAVVAAERARLELQRAHNLRQRGRARAASTAVLEELLGSLPPPPYASLRRFAAGRLENVRAAPFAGADCNTAAWWDAIPPAARPDAVLGSSASGAFGPAPSSGLSDDRLVRKQLQVMSFALVLRLLLRNACNSGAADATTPDTRLRVVDFGCGTGGLTLPLAALFPSCDFVGVDCNARSVALLATRAAAAALPNAAAVCCRIDEYSAPFDVGLALHACGGATDEAISKCEAQRAAFAVSPCCLGKLRFAIGAPGGGGVTHPRSQWMATALDAALKPSITHQRPHDGASPHAHARADAVVSSPQDAFARLAAAADVSHAEGRAAAPASVDAPAPPPPPAPPAVSSEAGAVRVARRAALAVTLDRACRAAERGCSVAVLSLLRPEAQAKNHLIVGVARGGAHAAGWVPLVEALAEEAAGDAWMANTSE